MLARLKDYKHTHPETGVVFRSCGQKLKARQCLDCLTLYADADLAGDRRDSKSTSGYSVHLGESGMFDWKTKKQSCVCQSSCESEVLSNKLATLHAIWLRQGLSEMGFTFSLPTPVCQDNQSAIAVCKSDKHHSRSRHFRMHIHLLKDSLLKNITRYPWVPTKHMRGDLFNKMHGPAAHARLMEMNQISHEPLSQLSAKAEPIVIDGWAERVKAEAEAQKTSEAKAQSAPDARQPGRGRRNATPNRR
jgi:hypothetical protein